MSCLCLRPLVKMLCLNFLLKLMLCSTFHVFGVGQKQDSNKWSQKDEQMPVTNLGEVAVRY